MSIDLAWEMELVPSMPQECVGNNIAHVSVTSLLVSFGQIYILGSYYKIGVCMMVHIKQ